MDKSPFKKANGTRKNVKLNGGFVVLTELAGQMNGPIGTYQYCSYGATEGLNKLTWRAYIYKSIMLMHGAITNRNCVGRVLPRWKDGGRKGVGKGGGGGTPFTMPSNY